MVMVMGVTPVSTAPFSRKLFVGLFVLTLQEY